MEPSHQSNSFYSSIPSEAPIDFYPFKYDEEMELDELDSFQSGPVTPPRLGSKIDEIFDSYFEDCLFRTVFSQPLKYSPLAMKFAFGNGRNRGNILLKGAISYSLFGPSCSSMALLQWNKVLYQESLLDAGIYTPADLVVDSESSHRSNRRAVYEIADRFKELAVVRAGRMRSFWRYFCHFTIYFVKGVFAGFGMYTTDRFILPYLNLNK